MDKIFSRTPWWLLIGLCLTLGLAPFQPEPHLLQKLKLLLAAQLNQPIDIFDLLLHAMPWVLLALKLFYWLSSKSAGAGLD